MNANDTSLTYRQRFLKNQMSFNRKYKVIFDKIADDFSLLINDPNIKFSKAFKFPPVINKKIKAIIADFQAKTLKLTEQQIEFSWNLSNSKNDEILSDYLKTVTKITAAQEATYFAPNVPALKAFISSDKGAGTLSKAIWQIGAQLRSELETHLGIGILQGDSANVISQRIRTYLKNPDSLFRRVRDAKGRLVASKAMQANAPGQGVYNSAFKNAMRVARTSTNQAYQLADSIRWRQLPMVIGIEIKLSPQHPSYNFVEICEELAGVYPKTYVFIGNHPQCLCIAIPILMPKEDFDKYLVGDQPLKAKQITEYPPNFKEFWKNNFERYSNYKTMPYIMQENLKVIKEVIK